MKVAINGMGRIGRLLVKKFISNSVSGLQLTAINSLYPPETLAHLLKYDTTHRAWDVDIEIFDRYIRINGKQIKLTMERDPLQIPWSILGVHLVVDATGRFIDRESAGKHILAGASSVIVTAPGKDLDLTVVMGVNELDYDPDTHHLLSAASCTTNALAPILKILDTYKVEKGWLTTVHAYTNDQNHLDNPHSDLRRARACTQSIIPTSTGAGKAIKEVLPHLGDAIRGLSLRVPVQDVSLLDLTVRLKSPFTIEQIIKTFQVASKGDFSEYIAYTEEPLVSSDFIGNAKSAIIDGTSLMANSQELKLLAWYDNEWGYVSRVYDLVKHVYLQKSWNTISVDNSYKNI